MAAAPSRSGRMDQLAAAGDHRVCEQCKTLANRDMGKGPGIYTLDQVEPLIPVHPRCRCTTIPLDMTEEKETNDT